MKGTWYNRLLKYIFNKDFFIFSLLWTFAKIYGIITAVMIAVLVNIIGGFWISDKTQDIPVVNIFTESIYPDDVREIFRQIGRLVDDELSKRGI